MNLKRQITRRWLAALPSEEQRHLVQDFVGWVYPELPAGDSREKAQRLEARLLEWIPGTQSGVWVVLFAHLRRLPILRSLDPEPHEERLSL
ncbi:MAG TPA: hypothetical protein VFI11_14125 [Anaerolineales bacterium]|nr:hypothetical protein [Anaerolineales bacterium]